MNSHLDTTITTDGKINNPNKEVNNFYSIILYWVSCCESLLKGSNSKIYSYSF